jgi:hypothetical protein
MRGNAADAIPPGEMTGNATLLVRRGLLGDAIRYSGFCIPYSPFIDDEDEHQHETE